MSKTKKKKINKDNQSVKVKKVKEGGRLKILPLGDRIVVRPLVAENQNNSFGIFIPETIEKEKPETGIVVAVGEGRRGDDGKLIPMRLRIGDRVMFSKYGYDDVKIDGEDYFILKEDSVLAVIVNK